MLTTHPELMPVLRKEERLRSLHRALTWGGSSAGFLWVLFWMPFGLIFTVLLLAAVLFAPYLLFSLVRLGRKGWVLAFALFVLLPIGVAVVSVTGASVGLLPGVGGITLPNTVAGYLLFILPLLTFYGYAFILRYSVGEWLEEARWARKDMEQRLGACMDSGGGSPGDGPGDDPGETPTRPSRS